MNTRYSGERGKQKSQIIAQQKVHMCIFENRVIFAASKDSIKTLELQLLKI